MAAITLESDSNHSPPVLTKSNDRSSTKHPQKANNLVEDGGLLREFSQARRIIPRPFRGRAPTDPEEAPENRNAVISIGFLLGSTILDESEATASPYERKVNVVKIKNTNE
jgi:hypothetical protein